MPRPGSREQRGYDYHHQLARRKALSVFVQGSLCVLCGLPMFHPEQKLDLDHSVPCVFGGDGPRRLTHASCNRREGTLLRNRLYRHKRKLADYEGLGTSRQW